MHLQTAVALFVFLIGSVAWGQTRLGLFSNGGTLENPNLDDNSLLKHSMYGEDLLKGNWDCKFPKGGLVGTNGKFTGGQITLQSQAAFLKQNSGSSGPVISNGCKVYYQTYTSGANISGATQRSPVYDATKTPDGYPVPRLPDTTGLEAAISSAKQRGITVGTSLSSSINAGIYVINGDVTIANNTTYTINPVNNDYKTIIYIKGNLHLRQGARIVPKDFVSLTQPGSADKILVIVTSSKGTGEVGVDPINPSGAIHLTSGTNTIAVGSYIAPYGAIHLQSEARTAGHLSGKEINVTTYDGGAYFNFVPWTPSVAESNPITVFEDKNWGGSMRGIGYADGAPWRYYKNANHTVTYNVFKLNKATGKDLLVPITFWKQNGQQISFHNSNAGAIVMGANGITTQSNPAGNRMTFDLDAASNKPNALIPEPSGPDAAYTRYIKVSSTDTLVSFNLNIIDDGDYQNDTVITVKFGIPKEANITNGNWSFGTATSNLIVQIPENTITLRCDDPVITKPTIDAPVLGTVIEKVDNGTGWAKPTQSELTGAGTSGSSYGAGQVAATLTGRGGISGGRYNFSIVEGNGNGWFGINVKSSNSAEIVTTSSYNADYENSAQRSYTLKVVAIDSTVISSGGISASNAAAIAAATSGQQTVTVNINPWNDNRFVTQNVSKSINEPNGSDASVKIAVSELVKSDADAGTNNHRIVGISTTNVKTRNISSGGTASISSNVIATGNVNNTATISLASNEVTYTIPDNINKVTKETDVFYITVRDSAAYGYATDYFDTTVAVTVTINAKDRFKPVVSNIVPLTLREDGKIEVAIKDLTITDADSGGISPAGHYTPQFVPDPTSLLKSLGISGVKVDIINGKLVYDLTSVAASYEFNGTFVDEISFQVKSDGQTSDVYKIPVTITPINDNAPVAKDFYADTVLTGGQKTILESTFKLNVTDADRHPNTSDIFKLYQIGNVTNGNGTNIKSSMAGDNLISVVINPTDSSNLTVIVPQFYRDDIYGKEIKIQYKVIDYASYDPLKQNTSVDFKTITLTVYRSDADVINPSMTPDTIIVRQGDATRLLYDLVRDNVLGNDTMKNKIGGLATADMAMLIDATKSGQIDLASDGTFFYSHDGDNTPAENKRPSDLFKYSVGFKNSYNETLWSHEIPGSPVGDVFIFVNRTRKDEAPILVDKDGILNANVKREFDLLDERDKDPDLRAGLKIVSTPFVSSVKGADAALVEITPDLNKITFEYKGEIDDTIEVVVKYFVLDTLNVEHARYNSAKGLDWFDTTITSQDNRTPYEQYLTITVIPNPKAFGDSMVVREGGVNDKFIFNKDSVYMSVSGNDKFIENASSYEFVLIDSTKFGKLNTEKFKTTGGVEYKHEVAGEFKDEFYYAIKYYLAGDPTPRFSDTVRVVIEIRPAAPSLSDKPSFYEDVKGSGRIDRVTIHFDRDVDMYLISFKVNYAEAEVDYEDVAYGKDESGIEDKKVLVLTLYNGDVDSKGNPVKSSVKRSPVDNTNGEMIVLIKRGGYDEDDITAFPKDKAAPVIKGDHAVYIRSFGFGSDTLRLSLSEIAAPSISNFPNLPFKFKRTENDSVYTIRFDEAIHTGSGNYTLIINSNDHEGIMDGDSVWINDAAAVKIKDSENNAQIIPENKRVEVKMQVITKLGDSSAAYFEVKDTADGYVDMIKLDVGMKIDLKIAQVLADSLKSQGGFPRGFEVGGVALVNDSIIEFSGKEKKAINVYEKHEKRDDNLPKTYVDTSDYIWLKDDLTVGTLTIRNGKIFVKDSVAPVVLRGTYDFKVDGKDTVAMLKVEFSEKVKLTSGNQYDFIRKSKDPKIAGETYKMVLSNAVPTAVNDSTVRYKVESVSVTYPMRLDSLWIARFTGVTDVHGNDQNLTVKAPLYLEREYDSKIVSYVVPNPVNLLKNGSGYDTKKLDPDLLEYFGLGDKLNDPNYNAGTLVVVELNGPVDVSKQSGALKVLDQTGNLVYEKALTPVVTKSGGVALVAVWNGRNSAAGRIVGPSTYLALIQVEAYFEGKDNVKESKELRNLIAVTIGGEMVEK